MKNLMRIKYALLVFISAILASWGSTALAHENHLIGSERDVEVVYFFSHACPTCRLMSPYINTFNKAFPEVVRIPVYSDKVLNDAWQAAARRFFLLKILHHEGLINATTSELERIGYAVQDQDANSIQDSAASFIDFLKTFGIQISEAQLKGPWELSELYMQDSLVMINRVRQELGRVATPVIRISSPAGVDYITISPESDDPPMDFLIRASESIKRHKKASIAVSGQASAAPTSPAQ